MSYQVLALKWRPQKFEDVIGQTHVTRTLQNAIRRERVPHAFLFTGSRGVGKTTTARILAKALVCEHGPTDEPCDGCRFCKEVKEGRSLDVLEIDGASNRGIDEIRELRENVRYAPSAARCKIYIIDEVHMLTKEAFNALLKTLEEPPAHVKFIFATTEVAKVPITIQSRCQRFDFRLLGREEILGQLKKIIGAEEVEISDAALSAIAGAAEGSLRDSQSLLDQVLAFSGRTVEEKDVYEALGIAEEKTVIEFLGGLMERDGAGCLRILDGMAAAGHDPKSFTREVLTGLRNLAVLKTSADLGKLVSASQEGLAGLQKLAETAGLGKIQSLFDIFLRAEGEIRNTSYPRMLLELSVLRAVRVEEVEGLRELVERLETLERKMPSGAAQGMKVSAPSPAPPTAPAGQAEESSNPGPRSSECLPEDKREDDHDDLFRRLIRRVRKDGVVLASFLEHGRLTRVGQTELEVSFKAGNGLFINTLGEVENLVLLRRAAGEVLGRKMEVRLVSVASDQGKISEKKPQETDLKKKYRREALEHPLIQEVLEVFQAQVVDVRVL